MGKARRRITEIPEAELVRLYCELRLSALNVLNQKPHFLPNPFPEAAPYDSTNESPVGRFVGASIRKNW